MNAPLQLTGDAAPVLAGIARQHLAEAARAAERLTGNDAEALHDFRVALRRLRTLLRGTRHAVDLGIPKRRLKRLQQLAASTSPARDHEVLLAWLTQQQATLTPSQRPGWRVVLDQLGRIAPPCPPDRLQRRFARLQRKLLADLADPPRTGLPFHHVLARSLRQQSAQLATQLHATTHATQIEPPHRARITIKRLRYLCEPLQGTLDEAEPLIRQCKQWQDLLGDLHDRQVWLQWLQASAGPAGEAYAESSIRQTIDTAAAFTRLRRHDPLPGLSALALRARAQRETLFETWQQHRAAGEEARLLDTLEQLICRLEHPLDGPTP